MNADLLRKALEFLEGCDPSLTSGGHKNQALRGEIRARLSHAGAGGVVDARQIAERVAGLVSLNKEAFAVEKAILSALAPSPSAGAAPAGEITSAMMDAGQRYIDRVAYKGQHILPAQFRWTEFWSEIMAAAPTPPAPVQPTASVEAVAAIIAKWVDEERFADAPAFRMAAREITASLTPAPTQGDGK